jgi:hypothetical protein
MRKWEEKLNIHPLTFSNVFLCTRGISTFDGEASLESKFRFERFQVLTAASMKMAVSWDVAPCSLVEVYRRFRDAGCLHHQGPIIALMMNAVSTSETSVKFYQTTRRNIPQNSHLHFRFLCHCNELV